MKTHKITCIAALVAAAGLLAGCDRSIEGASQDFNALPTAVQKTIRAEAPNAEIAKIDKTSVNGVDAYRVEFRQDGENSEMLVALDGKVLKSDMPAKQDGLVKNVERALTPTGAVGTQFSALPAATQKAILEHAPQTEIADIERKEDNGRVIYEIEFKDQGKNPTLMVAEDGTLVQSLQK